MANRTIPPEQLATAEQMLADGKSLRETSKATGLSRDTLQRRFLKPKGGDPPPRGKPGGAGPSIPNTFTPKTKDGAPTDEQLEQALRGVLKLCSAPMRLRCDYCADHMQRTAAATAAAAITDPEVRKIIVWIWTNLRLDTSAPLIAFFGIPVLHHLAPMFVYRMAAPLLGMPPRGEHRHTPGAAFEMPAATPENGAAPGAGLFAGLDTDQLLATAQAMGVEVPDEVLQALAPDAGTESTESADPPAEPDLHAGSDNPEPAAENGEAPAAPADQNPEL